MTVSYNRSAEGLRVDRETGRAEGTIDRDDALVANHGLALFGRKSRDYRADIFGIAAATLAERHGRESADLFLVVEQAPQQIVERKIGIGQLLGLHRSPHDRNMRPIRVVEPSVQPLAPVLALGQVLEQEATGVPVALPLLRRKADQARNLLGLREIVLCGIRKVLALQRDDALISFVGDRLVEGDREI